MNPLEALAERWNQEADTLEQRYREVQMAHIFRTHAAELEEAIRSVQDESLTLAEGARESGYSVDHLRHLVSEGTINNAGSKGRPRIRRGDLPTKPGIKGGALTDEATRQAREILQAVKRRHA